MERPMSEYELFRAQHLNQLQVDTERMFDGENEKTEPTVGFSPTRKLIQSTAMITPQLMTQLTPVMKTNQTAETDYKAKYEKLLIEHRQAHEIILKQSGEIERLRKLVQEKQLKDKKLREVLEGWVSRAKGNLIGS